MNPMQGAALVTLLTILLHIWITMRVGSMRAKTGVKAPATTGDPAFERSYRVQMNTIESTVIFLPGLWIAALYGHATLATILGAVWILGRIWYALGYARAAEARTPGFTVSTLAASALLIDAFVGLARSLSVGA
jgi:uncharacterized MAPEG superfamily protein